MRCSHTSTLLNHACYFQAKSLINALHTRNLGFGEICALICSTLNSRNFNETFEFLFTYDGNFFLARSKDVLLSKNLNLERNSSTISKLMKILDDQSSVYTLNEDFNDNEWKCKDNNWRERSNKTMCFGSLLTVDWSIFRACEKNSCESITVLVHRSASRLTLYTQRYTSVAHATR